VGQRIRTAATAGDGDYRNALSAAVEQLRALKAEGVNVMAQLIVARARVRAGSKEKDPRAEPVWYLEPAMIAELLYSDETVAAPERLPLDKRQDILNDILPLLEGTNTAFWMECGGVLRLLAATDRPSHVDFRVFERAIRRTGDLPLGLVVAMYGLSPEDALKALLDVVGHEAGESKRIAKLVADVHDARIRKPGETPAQRQARQEKAVGVVAQFARHDAWYVRTYAAAAIRRDMRLHVLNPDILQSPMKDKDERVLWFALGAEEFLRRRDAGRSESGRGESP